MPSLSFAGVTLDADSGRVFLPDGRVVLHLAGHEKTVLAKLLDRPNEPVTHSELWAAVRGMRDIGPLPKIVTVIIHRLRQKMIGLPIAITNKHNVGYQIYEAQSHVCPTCGRPPLRASV